ncbi:rod shape-determining protein MreD [Atopomonas sediminilitoris]|uniref:rod shape-determining protein MreD n=1 Tax=Atopomonas sediminilitoris TaxID=2919919 RepID=UPI001F4DEECC|nr:rod shape-determining protein MreD [Atopomonas sediminilitoris]MCJ8169979.1 rod shape-determining protein MreD [Atopomonas sediminilitoris]
MAGVKANNGWVVWLSLAVALLLSVAPMPKSLELVRPLWPALVLVFWCLQTPHKVGMTTAWLLGLCEDVLYGQLLGQGALCLVVLAFLVLLLHQRLRMFPVWQQALILLMLLGISQLLQLWLNALVGNRPPTLLFLLPAAVSVLVWPWVYGLLSGVKRRFAVN